MITWLRRERFAFLGLGSNVGDRFTNLQQAVTALDTDEHTRVDDVSSVYETDPVGGPEQDPYYNVAVRVATRRSPRSLLRLCHEIEARLGRERTIRWGPRSIDLDILLYEQRRVSTRSLEVPHPRLLERPFALVPLIEVAPGQRLPDGTTLTAALARLAPVEGVRKIGEQVRAPGAPG